MLNAAGFLYLPRCFLPQAIVQVCVSVVVKFGILVVLTLLAKIDICLNLLLVNLGICVEGLLHLVAEM
jgi:hypothetical protein